MTLIEQLDALIAEHRLSSITITRIAGREGYGSFWGINAQADGLIGSNTDSTDHSRPACVSEGLERAIASVNAQRVAPVIVPELELVA